MTLIEQFRALRKAESREGYGQREAEERAIAKLVLSLQSETTRTPGRGDAVNLARNVLGRDGEPEMQPTRRGIVTLAEAVLFMDAWIRAVPQGPVLSGIQDTPDTVAGTGSALPKPASSLPSAERLISYESLQERCNELLDSLRDIRDVVDSLALAKQIAAVVLDGDKIIW